jgi:hypothetical protein
MQNEEFFPLNFLRFQKSWPKSREFDIPTEENVAKSFSHDSDVPKIGMGYLPKNKPDTLPPLHVCQPVFGDFAPEQKSDAGCDAAWSKDHKVLLCFSLPINGNQPLS